MKEWRSIQGYEGLYEVSSEGNVRSVPRNVMNKHGKPQWYPGKQLTFDTLVTTNTTYYRVTLSKNNKVTRYSVHRLVAEAFIPNLDNKPDVNHLDNNGSNNCSSNLEWCTHSENMLHAQLQGRLTESQSKGGKQGSIKEVTAAIAKSNKVVGCTFGKWKVLHPLGKQGKGKGKYYVQCLCLGCLREFRVETGRLLRQESKSCRACSRAR